MTSTPRDQPPPRVHVVATGGTIAMTGTPARPARSGAELVAAVPGLEAVAEVGAHELANVPGVDLTPALAAAAGASAAEAVAAGARGAIVLQGTDTIEESAELLDLVWSADAPLCLTGAMRPGGAAGADGPANLLDAARVAAHPAARGLGAVVVFDGLVHAARDAVKSHSWRTGGFASPAPLGAVREGRVEIAVRPPRRAPVAEPARLGGLQLDRLVPIVAAAAGLDARPLDAVREAGAEAIVLHALGAGHVPEPMLPGIDRALAAGVPVVVCARPAAGGTLESTYGFAGSEVELARRGALLAGTASPWKARIRVLVALALGRDPAALFDRQAGAA